MQCDLCKKKIVSSYETLSNQEMQCAVLTDSFNPYENTEILKHIKASYSSYSVSMGNMPLKAFSFLLSSQEGRKGLYKMFKDSLSKRTHDWKLCQYCYETIIAFKRTPPLPPANEDSDSILQKNHINMRQAKRLKSLILPIPKNLPEERTLNGDLNNGIVLANSGKWEDALVVFQNEQKKTPDFDVPYIWLANLFEDKKEFHKSLNFLKKGIEECRRKSLLLAQAGELALMRLNDLSLSIQFFVQAVAAMEKKPDKRDLTFQRACLFLKEIFKSFSNDSGVKWTENIQNETEFDESFSSQIHSKIKNRPHPELQDIQQKLAEVVNFLNRCFPVLSGQEFENKTQTDMPKNENENRSISNSVSDDIQLNLSSVMGIIQNNPFRVLGVPIQISSKDLSKQLSKAKIFAEMGKELDYETDFIFLPKLTRNIEELDSAVNKIENYQNRLLFCLFWFWERNKSDELIFELLKQGNAIKALSLLKKQAILAPSDSNYSTIWNYVVLNLTVAFSTADKDGSCLKEGVRFAGKLMNQELFSNSVSDLLGETYPFDWEKLWKNYIKKLLKNIQTFFKPEQISNKDLVNCFRDYSKQMSSFAIGQLVNPSIYFVEEQANIASIRQKQNLEQSLNYGYELADNIIEDLTTIKNTLGENDFQFQAVTDKAATVILQCAIEYYNAFHKDSSKKDVCKNSIELIKISKKLAIGNELVKRIDENLKILETSFPADPEAEKAFKKITEKAKWLIEETDSLNKNWSPRRYHKAITNFLDEVIPQLKILKNKLGDEQYLQISTNMASLALNLTINYYNKTKKHTNTIWLFERIKILEANTDYSFKTHFEKNLQIINQNKKISDKQFGDSPAGGCLSFIFLGVIIYIIVKIALWWNDFNRWF